MPLLFSYGTLQQQNVQLATFGRLLKGSPDSLVGFVQTLFEMAIRKWSGPAAKLITRWLRSRGCGSSRFPVWSSR